METKSSPQAVWTGRGVATHAAYVETTLCGKPVTQVAHDGDIGHVNCYRCLASLGQRAIRR